MTSISGKRPPPVALTSTQSTSPASAPAAKQAQQAASGQVTNDTFKATPKTSNAMKVVSEGKAALENLPEGPDRDALMKALGKPWPNDKELKAAQKALQNLANNPPEGMSEQDFKKIQNAVGYQQNNHTIMGMVNSSFSAMIEEARKRGDKKD